MLRGVSLQLRAGEAAGLVGANGSGKSTLLRILCTLVRPTAGSALVFGADVAHDPDLVRESVGFFSPIPGVYDDLTALENVDRKSTRLNSSHIQKYRMPSSA